MKKRQPFRDSLVAVLVAAAMLAGPSAPGAAALATRDPAAPAAGKVQPAGPASAVLFRATVTVRTAMQRQKLDREHVQVLAWHGSQALVLADAYQLETLARTRFEPTSVDEVSRLATADGAMPQWLQRGLQPLLARAAAIDAAPPRDEAYAQQAAGPEVQALRAAVAALSPEQKAALSDTPSLDDDADGLTNTEESWWCTNALNADSDGDGATDGVEVQAARDWLANRTAGFGAFGKPFSRWPPDHPGCNDDDRDSVPDLAERWDLGLNMNRESTDRDKFDDGQELFGLTNCPGSGGYCGYGALPRDADWGVIFAEMPAWVEAPGRHPFVAAYPVPRIEVVQSSLKVETVSVVTTDHTISSGTEKSYATTKLTGVSDGNTDTTTWNNWSEVSTTKPLRTAVASANPDSPNVGPLVLLSLAGLISGEVNSKIDQALALPGAVESVMNIGDRVCQKKHWWNELFCSAHNYLFNDATSSGQSVTNVQNITVNVDSVDGLFAFCPGGTCSGTVSNVQQSSTAVAITEAPNVDTGNKAPASAGQATQVNSSSELQTQPVYRVSAPAPRKTKTKSSGESEGGAQATTHETYEEQTVTNTEAFSDAESWGTATAGDSAHAADFWFSYRVSNMGTEYAREICDLAFNVYIGADPGPAHTYRVAPDLGGDGCFHNFMPGEQHEYSARTGTHAIPLSLDQMRAIDLGEPVRVIIEDYSYGIDELFHEDAVTAGMVFAIEDGHDDGDETIEPFVLPTWGDETILDVLTRYFPVETDVRGALIAMWTPERRNDVPGWCLDPQTIGAGTNGRVWCKHGLSELEWWNLYSTDLGDGPVQVHLAPAVAGGLAFFRFNKDADFDGYGDRFEIGQGTDPQDAGSYPAPGLVAGMHTTRTGNLVTATLSFLNTGLSKAYGVQAVMVAPDDSVTVTNHSVGGSGVVPAMAHVVVGTRMWLEDPLPTPWQQEGHALPRASGYYTGNEDRTYTFTVDCSNPGGCRVGADAWHVLWDDGLGDSGSLNFGAGYNSPLPEDVGAYGLTLAFLSGAAYDAESFTIETYAPADTFRYTINREPYTAPVVFVSYNDPQGQHRFVLPDAAMSLGSPNEDLSPLSGQMLRGAGIEILARGAAVNGQNTTDLLVYNPTARTLESAAVFLEFVDAEGRVALEAKVVQSFRPGPTIVAVDWDTAQFSPAYDPTKDYTVFALLTDRQGIVADVYGRPLWSFAADRAAEARVPVINWDVGTIAYSAAFSILNSLVGASHASPVTRVSSTFGLQGTAGQPASSSSGSTNYRLSSGYLAAVKARENAATTASAAAVRLANDAVERFPSRTFFLGSTGWSPLYLGEDNSDPDIAVTRPAAETVEIASSTSLGLRVNTDGLPLGPFQKTVPVRTNDPARPIVEFHITGVVEQDPRTVWVYGYRDEARPLNKITHVSSTRYAGETVRFRPEIGGDTAALQPLFLLAGDDATELGRGAAIEAGEPVLAQVPGDSNSTDMTLVEPTSARRDYVVRYGYEAVLGAGGGQTTYQAPLPNHNYDAVTLDILGHNLANTTVSLSLDVGTDGSAEWSFSGDIAAAGGVVTATGLAAAINSYRNGRTGEEVFVPLRLSSDTGGTYFLLNLRGARSTDYEPRLVGGISVSNSAPTETETVHLCADAINDGLGTLPGVVVSFFSGDPATDGYAIGHALLTDVAAQGGGASACIDWDTTGFTGDFTLRAVADHWDLVDESNEADNTVTAPISIKTRPDLHITQVVLSDEEPIAGQAVTATVTLRNDGQTVAGSSVLALYGGDPDAGGALIAQASTEVAAGAAATVDLPWTPAAAGPHRLFTRADREGQVNEYDEANNDTWRDAYVGLVSPLLIDSGDTAGDPMYAGNLGYGAVDEGQPDVVSGCGSEPHQTFRQDPDGKVTYRFNHLLPGHFYHLDLSLYECGQGVGRQETIEVDGQQIAGPEDLGDGQVHRLSLLLDPAFYADRTITVTVSEAAALGALVNEISLHDIDYRYSDSGGANDAQYPGPAGAEKSYGWLDGTPISAWGTLPYQTARADQLDNKVRYRYDGLDPDLRYRLFFSFYEGSGDPRREQVWIDGVNTGTEVYIVAGTRLTTFVSVPVEAYYSDGTIEVSIVRTDAGSNAMVNEIALEQRTRLNLPVISGIRVSNISDVGATISWLTGVQASGMVHYGTTKALGKSAQDARGSTTSAMTHYANLTGLSPNTTYYFYVSSADAVDDQGGAYYSFRTGPALSPPASDTVYGQVFRPDGTTPAQGALVYIALKDANGVGSPGQAAPRASLVDASGYWNTNLAAARTAGLTGYFAYSASGDRVALSATDGECMAEQEVDTSSDAPAASLVLICPTVVSHDLAIGWNLLGLNVQPAATPHAEAALDDIEAQGGNASEVDRWVNGGWDAHVHNLPFNDFVLELGKGYFFRSDAAGAWQRSGWPPATPLTLSLYPGWNLVAFPKLNASLTAESVLVGIAGQGGACSEIDRWYNGGWEGHIKGLPFNNFTIETGEGYFVKCTQDSSYTPGATALAGEDTWPEPAAGAEPRPAPGTAAISGVTITGVRDVAATVTWRTNRSTTGEVVFGAGAGAARIAHDVRGKETASPLHYVTLTGLRPATRYTLRVRSAGGGEEDGPYTFTTRPSGTPSTPNAAYGTVALAGGKPAAGALVFAYITDASGRQSDPVSALVDGWGYWSLDLPLDDCTGARLTLAAIAPDGSQADASGAACDVRPAPHLVTGQGAATPQYLPLIAR